MLASIIKVSREMRQGRYDDAELERQLENRGLMNRFLGRYAKRIDTPWKIYPVGVLFGLGFDTATEVALLVLAGSAVVGGLPFYAVLSLPILFAAGMCLFDTLDGCFMNFAYDWAFAKPIRKIYYNLTITGLSVFVALFIGTMRSSASLRANTTSPADSGTSCRTSTSTGPGSSSWVSSSSPGSWRWPSGTSDRSNENGSCRPPKPGPKRTRVQGSRVAASLPNVGKQAIRLDLRTRPTRGKRWMSADHEARVLESHAPENDRRSAFGSGRVGPQDR